MCKSLVSKASQAVPQEPRSMHIQPPSREAPPTPSPTTTGSGVPRFSPDAEYFTMKQLAIAVLVSFITGAASVTCVILIVWRCRNCH
ncbi:hypothetical protein MAR_011255, partial [Mya arenaria]